MLCSGVLVASIFSFSNYIFTRLLSQGHLETVRCGRRLTLDAPCTEQVACVASVDQDQAAQNVQPDLDLLCLLCLDITGKRWLWICSYLCHIVELKCSLGSCGCLLVKEHFVFLTLSSIYTCFNTLKKKALRKHCGKQKQ